MSRISIRNEQKRFRAELRAVRALVAFVLGEEGAPGGEVSVLITDNAGIQRLNRLWLKRDRPTDVLAFPAGSPGVFLGDVAVSAERAGEQAGRFGQSPAEELALCLVHGILHLFGYTDHPPRRRREMARRERAILRRWLAARGRPARRAGGKAVAAPEAARLPREEFRAARLRRRQ